MINKDLIMERDRLRGKVKEVIELKKNSGGKLTEFLDELRDTLLDSLNALYYSDIYRIDCLKADLRYLEEDIDKTENFRTKRYMEELINKLREEYCMLLNKEVDRE